jgi:hypothetical protein
VVDVGTVQQLSACNWRHVWSLAASALSQAAQKRNVKVNGHTFLVVFEWCGGVVSKEMCWD